MPERVKRLRAEAAACLHLAERTSYGPEKDRLQHQAELHLAEAEQRERQRLKAGQSTDRHLPDAPASPQRALA